MGIEALSRGAASVTFVDHDAGRAWRRCGPTWPRSGLGRPRRPRSCGPSCRRGCAAAPRFDLALCDPPYALRRLGDPARPAPTPSVAVLESDRAGRRCRRAGRSSRTTPLRRYARHGGSDPSTTPAEPTGDRRDRRPHPRLVRPVPQRPPRGGRAGRPALRRGGGGRPAQPAEGRAPVQPGRARGDARGGPRAPAERPHRLGVHAGRERGPGRRGLGHREGPAGGLGLRERAADGPDEPPAVGGRDRSSSRPARPTRSWPRACCARSPATAATCRPSCPRRSATPAAGEVRAGEAAQ